MYFEAIGKLGLKPSLDYVNSIYTDQFLNIPKKEDVACQVKLQKAEWLEWRHDERFLNQFSHGTTFLLSLFTTV